MIKSRMIIVLLLSVALQSCVTISILYTVDFNRVKKPCYDLSNYTISQIDSILVLNTDNDDLILCSEHYPKCLYVDTIDTSCIQRRDGVRVRHLDFFVPHTNCVFNGKLEETKEYICLIFDAYTILDENYRYAKSDHVVSLHSAHMYAFQHSRKLRRKFQQYRIEEKLDSVICSMFDTSKKWKAIEPLLGYKSIRKND